MTQRSPITTHVLDLSRGCPASQVAVTLDRKMPSGDWSPLADATTDEDGRVADLLQSGSLKAGRYRLTFATGDYYQAQGVETFYPSVSVEFEVTATDQHYHVPLLVSPFGYSTYRGS